MSPNFIYLTHYSRKAKGYRPRGQTKQHAAIIFMAQLTGGMCFLGFQQVCSLCALSFSLGCSSSCSETISKAPTMLVCVKNTVLGWVSQKSYSTWLVPGTV